MEADKSADGGNGKRGVFEVLDGNVDSNGIEKAHWRLSELLLEQVVECGLTYEADLGKLCHRKLLGIMACDIFDGALQSFVKGDF